MEQLRVIMPAYLKRFTCLGPECEDPCCVGFKVPVDLITYGRYQRVQDPELREELRTHIVHGDNVLGLGKEGYARIVMREDGACPFYTDDRLCAIQGALGEASLCSACDNYPRSFRFVDGRAEVGGTLGCPEVARLALFDPAALDLVEGMEEPRAARNQRRGIGTLQTDRLPENNPLRLLPLVRALALDLLARPDVGLETRLLALGQALVPLSGRAALHAEEVRRAFAEQGNGLPSLDRRLAAIRPRHATRLVLLRALLALRHASGSAGARYQACFDRVTAGLGLDADTRAPLAPSIEAAYTAALTRYLLPYAERRPSVLENAVRNFAWWTDFPFTRGRPFVEDYAALVIYYALLKLHLLGAAAAEGGLADALVVEVAQSVERAMSGSLPFQASAIELLRREDALNVPTLAALLLH